MLPAQNRPRLSHLPSFIRVRTGVSSSGWPSGVTVPSSARWAKPWPLAVSQPPPNALLGTTAPTGEPSG